VDFELPGKQKLGTGELNIPWFKFNLNRILIESNRNVRVINARFVHETFEPKLAATQRTYLYRFIVRNGSFRFVSLHRVLLLLG
jgi:tRNA U38,U39,U40 pseudouridine synthase TruA